MRVTEGLEREWLRVDVMLRMARMLPIGMNEELLGVATGFEQTRARAETLAAIAPRFAGPKGLHVVEQALREAEPGSANPATADHPEGQISEPNPQGSSAVRILRPGSTLMYAYMVLNAHTEAGHPPDLEVQTRIFREGKQVYAGRPIPLHTAGSDPKRLVAGGTMRLGQQIGTGDYVLQVIVTDKQAKDKYPTATQAMDFEIR